jgi:hypothetical protein
MKVEEAGAEFIEAILSKDEAEIDTAMQKMFDAECDEKWIRVREEEQQRMDMFGFRI